MRTISHKKENNNAFVSRTSGFVSSYGFYNDCIQKKMLRMSTDLTNINKMKKN